MGLDLFFLTEKRDASGRWTRAEPLVPDPWSDEDKERPKPAPGMIRDEVYVSRNKVLLPVLRGFDGFYAPPLSPRPGLPIDVSEETSLECEYAEAEGDFCCGWLTLAELEAYPWTTTIVERFQSPRPMSEECRQFYYEALPALRTFGDPHDVRVIMMGNV